jgi:NAD(P)-dependent dehydrogenase (short-subunit alcohol dehydrogenase family)
MYLDRFNLRGRVAAVTGSGQGIGLACVEALSEAGAQFISRTAIPRRLRRARRR